MREVKGIAECDAEAAQVSRDEACVNIAVKCAGARDPAGSGIGVDRCDGNGVHDKSGIHGVRRRAGFAPINDRGKGFEAPSAVEVYVARTVHGPKHAG